MGSLYELAKKQGVDVSPFGLGAKNIADPLPKIDSVVVQEQNSLPKKRRGRPISGNALSPAEKQRAYRKRKKQSGEVAG